MDADILLKVGWSLADGHPLADVWLGRQLVGGRYDAGRLQQWSSGIREA